MLSSSHWQMLLDGALMTLAVSLAALVCAVPLALATCFMKMGRNPISSRLASLYVSFFRGTPLLVQLLIVFYITPAIGLDIPPVAAAIAALTLNTAAFQAEIFRGGFAAIPAGHVEAAQILGMPAFEIRTRILIPQMFRLVLPSFVNELILLLKGSSIISVIAVTELTRAGQQIVAITFEPLRIYLWCGALYLAMTLSLGLAGRALESWLRIDKAERVNA